MTSAELTTLRKAFGLTQTQMAERLGLKLRAYQDLEAGKSDVRKSHDEAAAMASLRIAVERGNPMLALPEVRRLALRLTQHIMGEDPAGAPAKEGPPVTRKMGWQNPD